MKSALSDLSDHVNDLKTASIIARGDIALRALDAALHAMRSLQNEINVLRVRLNTVEARAAKALNLANGVK